MFGIDPSALVETVNTIKRAAAMFDGMAADIAVLKAQMDRIEAMLSKERGTPIPIMVGAERRIANGRHK